jgi:hypothetical protein
LAIPNVLASIPTPTITAPANDNDGDFTVSWSSVPNVLRYEVWENDIRKYIGNATSMVRAKRPKGVYSYKVRACISGQGCGSYSVPASTTVVIPTPSLAVPSEVDNGSFTISWSLEAYVKRSELLENNQLVYSGTGTSNTRTKPPGNYSYQVRVCRDGQGCGEYSNASNVQVYIPAPIVNAPSTDEDGVYSVTWTAVSNVLRYQVYENGDLIYVGTNRNIDRTSTPGTYSYEAKACRSGQGCSNGSGTKSVFVPPKVEEILGNVSNITRSLDSVTVEGWFCHSNVNESNDVDIYLDNNGIKTFIGSYPANTAHSNSISINCSTSNIPHKFLAQTDSQELIDLGATGGKVVVYGTSVNSSISDTELPNSGSLSFPNTVLQRLSSLQPTDGKLTIASNQEVVMYGNYDFDNIEINGILRCTTGSPDIVLKAESIMVMGSQARFECGSNSYPFQGNFNIRVKSVGNVVDGFTAGMRIMVMNGGTISFHGKDTGKKWGVLNRHASKGDNSIIVESDIVIAINETIVIAPTSFDYSQAEQRVITDIEYTDSGAEKELFFGSPLIYDHIGRSVEYPDAFGDTTLDMRANVAVLDRNIKISPDSPNTTDSTKIGGDMMIMSGSKGYLSVVQFDRMGKMGS